MQYIGSRQRVKGASEQEEVVWKSVSELAQVDLSEFENLFAKSGNTQSQSSLSQALDLGGAQGAQGDVNGVESRRSLVANATDWESANDPANATGYRRSRRESITKIPVSNRKFLYLTFKPHL